MQLEHTAPEIRVYLYGVRTYNPRRACLRHHAHTYHFNPWQGRTRLPPPPSPRLWRCFYTTPTCTRDLSLPSSNPLSFVPSSLHASMSFQPKRPSRAHLAHIIQFELMFGASASPPSPPGATRLRRAFPLDSRMRPHVHIHTPSSTPGAFTRAFRMRPHATCEPELRG